MQLPGVMFVDGFFAVGMGSLHPDAGAESYGHEHLVSLDDADVIVFGLPRPPATYDTYMGKPSLNDDDSSWYKELLKRWRGELSSALEAGKTVFVVLTAPKVVYVATGEVQQSGTGRNALRTRVVTLQSNMEVLPYRLAEVVAGFGSEIRVAPRAEALRQYWSRFAPLSRYEIRFAPREGLTPLLTTKNPEQVVGAIVASKDGGHLVLLPALDLGQPDDDAYEDAEYDDYEDDDAEEAKGDSEGDEDEDHAAFRLNSIDFVHRCWRSTHCCGKDPFRPRPTGLRSPSTRLLLNAGCNRP